MAKAWNPKSKTSYTYSFVTGDTNCIQVDHDKVTESWIVFLAKEEHAAELKDRYQLEHTDFGYLNKLSAYRSQSDACWNIDPLEQISDPAADVFEILFPEASDEGQLEEKVKKAISLLTPQQQELVFSLFYEQKTLADFAREHSITYGAAKDRRRKILTRLQKLLSEENK